MKVSLPHNIDIADLIGKPFEWNGRGPNSYDCLGLCKEIYRRVGIEFPDPGTFQAVEEIDTHLEIGKKDFEQLEQPEPWCVVLFRIKGRYVSHMGIVLPNLYKFIHVLRGVSVCTEKLSSPDWCNRIAGYYRLCQK